MTTHFAHAILAVRNMDLARRFYVDGLGLAVNPERDYGVCFTLDGVNLMIHEEKGFRVNTRQAGAPDEPVVTANPNLIVYVETDDLEAAFDRVTAQGYRLIHGIEKQPWDQRVFRACDPDGNIVEVGEKSWHEFWE